jgi:hypothetical protein
MGVASRKTWLEKQPDDVQLAVLAMDDAGRTLEEIRQMLRDRFELDVPASTLHNALRCFREGIGHEERLAALLARRNRQFFEENPDVDPHAIARYQLTLAGSRIDASRIDARSFLAAAQSEAFIDLRRQELEIKRQANDLRRKKLEQENTALQLKIEQIERQRERERRQIEQLVQKDAQTALQEIKQIYGIA